MCVCLGTYNVCTYIYVTVNMANFGLPILGCTQLYLCKNGRLKFVWLAMLTLLLKLALWHTVYYYLFYSIKQKRKHEKL